MRFGSTRTILCVSALCLVLSCTVRAQSDDGCSVATLRGSYGEQTFGSIVSAGPVGAVAEAGVVDFDGAGNASLTSAVSLNGNIIPRRTSLSGTYVVNPDCTGEVAFVLPVPGGTTVSESHMVIVEHGKEFFLVNTGTGRVLVTTGKKQ